jgi:hypothetical protein
MKKVFLLMIGAACAISFIVPNVWALPQFKKEFDTKWVDKPDTDADFKKLAKKQSCNICHVKGKPKDNHNEFGVALEELIEGSAKERLQDATDKGKEAKEAEIEKLVKEFDEALKKVEVMKTADGSTYGQRLANHQLPVDPPADDGGDEPEDE